MTPPEPLQMPADSPAATPSVGTLDHPTRLARMVERHPERIADVAMDLWERLSAALVMIIGNDGFDALYDRSLHLTRATYPWLSPAGTPTGPARRFAQLRSGLQDRRAEEACQATVLLLTTFTGVLVTLIGQPLTTNILRAAWGDAYEQAALKPSPCPTK